MRRGARRHSQEEEEESAFVSMTDMTVSFLFILMILLAYFASQFKSGETVLKIQYDEVVETAENRKIKIEELLQKIRALEQKLEDVTRPNPLETYISQTANQRRELLEHLRKQLLAEFPDLNVVISAENDALRFQGDGLFNSNSAALKDQRTVQIVQRIAARLNEILPCYTLGAFSSRNKTCNPNDAIIEAVQIEGHTDASGPDIPNLTLSTARAVTTFAEMATRQPTLVEHRNFRDQTVLSVAGYGEMRPIADNNTPGGRATNRRIDLRIIMFTPGSTAEIEKIRAKLQPDASAKP